MTSRLIWKGAEVEAKIMDAAVTSVDETTDASASQARSVAAVLTGEMQAGIDTEAAQVSGHQVIGRLVARSGHSIFVEIGTNDTPAQPFLRPSADGENTKLAGRIRSKLS